MRYRKSFFILRFLSGWQKISAGIFFLFLLTIAPNRGVTAESGLPPSGKITCEFRALAENDQTIPARLYLADATGKWLPAEKNRPFYLLATARKIELAAGNYIAIFDAGARRKKVRVQFTVNNGAIITAKLAVHYWNEDVGWSMLNPLFDNSGAADNPAAPRSDLSAEKKLRIENYSELTALLQSAGLKICAVTHLDLLKMPDQRRYREVEESSGNTDIFGVAGKSSWFLSATNGAGWGIIDPQLPPPIFTKHPPDLLATLAAARDRGALTIFRSGENLAERLFALVAANLFQAIDITRGGDDYAFWQFLLQQGCRLPAVAGGGEFMNLSMYAQHDALAPTKTDFINALSTGRSLISNGPFVNFYAFNEIDNAMTAVGIGEIIPSSATPRTIIADAFASSDDGDFIKQIDLLYNGKVIESAKITTEEKSARVEWKKVELRTAGWLQVRYISTAPYLWAITNPLYVGEDYTPTGITTDLSLTINAPRGTGSLTAENFGEILFTRTVAAGEKLKLRLPATAEINVRFPNFPPRRSSIAELSGARRFCERVAQASSLRNKDWIVELRKMLREIEAEISIGQ